MTSNNYMISSLNMEEFADMESVSMDLALEQFFNNVLECIIIDEDVFCLEEWFLMVNIYQFSRMFVSFYLKTT